MATAAINHMSALAAAPASQPALGLAARMAALSLAKFVRAPPVAPAQHPALILPASGDRHTHSRELATGSSHTAPLHQPLFGSVSLRPSELYIVHNIGSTQRRSAHTQQQHKVVCKLSELGPQEREDYIYSGAFITSMRKCTPLPADISPQALEQTVDEYFKVGVDRHEVLTTFEDTVGFQMGRLSSTQLRGVATALEQMGVQNPQLQRKIFRESLRRGNDQAMQFADANLSNAFSLVSLALGR